MTELLLDKIPQLRFKSSGGSWNLRTIGDLVDEGLIYPPQDGNHGEIHPKKSDFVERGIPFVMANNIRDGDLDLRNCSRISLDQAKRLRKGFANTGDVLLTHKGTVGETAVVGTIEFPFIMLTPQVTYYRVVEDDKLDSQFLVVSFRTNRFQDALEEAAGGGTRAYIGILQQQSLSIAFPPEMLEQVQIGSYFKSLDRMLELHQQKHNKLVILKQAMLQKMFPQDGATTPEIRFKGFEGDWKETTLGNLGSVEMNRRIFKDQTLPVGEIPFYKIGTFGSDPDAFISRSLFEKYKRKYPYPNAGTVLISASGSIGRTVEYDGSDEYFQDSNIVWLQHDDQVLDIFLKQFYLIVKWHGLEGSTIKRLYNKNILETEIMLPETDEQQKIGTYFRNLDKLISKHTTQLEKLKNIKSACLEKMFV